MIQALKATLKTGESPGKLSKSIVDGPPGEINPRRSSRGIALPR
jgi:hypothetical protein